MYHFLEVQNTNKKMNVLQWKWKYKAKEVSLDQANKNQQNLHWWVMTTYTYFNVYVHVYTHVVLIDEATITA